MVVLVTGGSGFIGSHLVDKLIENGYDVRVLDLRPPLNEKAEFFKADLLSEEDVLDAFRDVEIVFHLAAVADVNVARVNPSLCLKVNEIGTLNVLNAAVANEVDRFVLASTSWVYGKTSGVVSEETPLPPPDNIYTKTKIGQEHLVSAFSSEHGLEYVVLRYGIPYGPRMRQNMAIAVFVRRAMKGLPITIYGDGEQGRCFIYVEDLAEANIYAMKPEAKNEVFNVAGKEFVTINKIVEKLEKIFGRIKKVYADPRPGDFRGAIISIEKAKRILGWEPKHSFEEGLRKYVDWVKKNMG